MIFLDLEREVNDIIDELGVTVKETPELDADAKYIALMDTIVIDSSLPDRIRLLRLLHELGHAAKHKNNFVLYRKANACRLKMEKEAEEFMIEKMIESRFSDPDFEPLSFSTTNFLESYDLDMKYEPIVKEFMTSYCIKSHLYSNFF